ncbi:hypothetical protein ABT187_44420 [Streptomyces sp. NPDC001817]|uniref:hypothetical protein n=1 Tax=Streptomyces sp. NPDC001817 TaxID=3154398 RepID=UPI00332A07AC
MPAIELRLRQLARAAETPAAPVELKPIIDSGLSTARGVRELAERMQLAVLLAHPRQHRPR